MHLRSILPSQFFKAGNAWLLLIGVFILMWGFIAWDLSRQRQQAFHHARVQLDNLTSVYAEEISSSIKAINYVLVDLRAEWKNNPEEFRQLVRQRREHLDPSIALTVEIIDVSGAPLLTTASGSATRTPLDLRGREHFRFHLFTERDQLHISEPILMRDPLRLVMHFSRPLPQKEEKFNGVIAASVSPEYFSRFHKKINLGTDSSIALARTNGALIVRSPRPGQAVDTSIEDAPWLDAGISMSGFFQKHSEVDHVERLYAWRVLEGGDLAVIMGQSTATILAPYHQQRTAYMGGGLAVTLLLLLAAIFIQRQQFQRAQATAKMQRMEQALVRSQKLESLGKLTGGVAHDFNNLLQVVGNSLELLEMKEGKAQELQPHLSSIADATKRGKQLVSQLLTFARRQPLHPTIVAPRTLIKGIEGLIQRLAGSGIELRTNVSERVWNIHVDPSLLENVILNLAANARDAMNGQGTLIISVSNERIEDSQTIQSPDIEAGDYVVFCLSDTGCGMSAEVMEQAFEPFFTTKPEGKGTGLGLAAAYGFIKESGGHIQIESEPGRGTIIKIFLPRTAEQVVPPLAPAVPSIGGTETLLFVEDNPQLRTMTGMLLEHLGYRVLKAADSKEALAILKKEEAIDILFSDIDLPGGINGVALAKQAQSLKPQLAILLASGYDDWDGSSEAGTGVPEFPFLHKPYTAQEAHVMITKLLAQKEAQELLDT